MITYEMLLELTFKSNINFCILWHCQLLKFQFYFFSFLFLFLLFYLFFFNFLIFILWSRFFFIYTSFRFSLAFCRARILRFRLWCLKIIFKLWFFLRFCHFLNFCLNCKTITYIFLQMELYWLIVRQIMSDVVSDGYQPRVISTHTFAKSTYLTNIDQALVIAYSIN
jgi:hypothetical protein